MSLIEGLNRGQPSLLPSCVEDYVAPHAQVRVVDAFVASLDLGELGFGRPVSAATGSPRLQPGPHAASLHLGLPQPNPKGGDGAVVWREDRSGHAFRSRTQARSRRRDEPRRHNFSRPSCGIQKPRLHPDSGPKRARALGLERLGLAWIDLPVVMKTGGGRPSEFILRERPSA
jgi:hypothetical protein